MILCPHLWPEPLYGLGVMSAKVSANKLAAFVVNQNGIGGLEMVIFETLSSPFGQQAKPLQLVIILAVQFLHRAAAAVNEVQKF